MPFVGMFRSTLSAIVRRMAAGLEGLAASSLLEESLETLASVAASHWSGSTIADIPEMIQDLARDRDDYKQMAESYRTQLAKIELELAESEMSLRMSMTYANEQIELHLIEIERLTKVKCRE